MSVHAPVYVCYVWLSSSFCGFQLRCQVWVTTSQGGQGKSFGDLVSESNRRAMCGVALHPLRWSVFWEVKLSQGRDFHRIHGTDGFIIFFGPQVLVENNRPNFQFSEWLWKTQRDSTWSIESIVCPLYIFVPVLALKASIATTAIVHSVLAALVSCQALWACCSNKDDLQEAKFTM